MPPTLALDEKIVALHAALEAARKPHAFGGALALAYYATPRGTIDIDCNVFVKVERAQRVLEVLAGLGVPHGERALAEIARDGQIRLRWGHTPIDLFFSTDAYHDACMERARRVPFGEGAEIPILAAEDLAVFKVVFDRPKDWVDLGELLYAQGGRFDAGHALEWLGRILGPDDPRVKRFAELVRGGDASA
ncbi:MAG TPA: hypothetical protein VFY49_05345 [Myxococcota bacterium]|nr:hypothetical protein [Myxococcota bacterium]